jgi:glycosyltransferase involved in cell wall biosynthesis
MKVACPLIGGSGLEVYHKRLGIGLSHLGVQSELVRFSPYWEFFPWALEWKARKIITALPVCDLVHTQAEYGHLFRRKGKPLVVTLHHSSVDREYLASLPLPTRLHHQFLLKSNVKAATQLADKLVAVSFYTRSSYGQLFGKDLEIQVIHNGIDPKLFRPLEVESSPAGSQVVIFFSGNHTRRKGFDLLEPVMKRLGSDFVLRYTAGLRQSGSGVADGLNMKCVGHLSEEQLLIEINKADIVFQPSRREGFGLSILEAMACSKPVVSTNCSAIPELLEHGQGGYLCEVDSVEQMVTAIRELACSAELRRKMGAHNRQVVLDRFTLELMASQYFNLYRSLLA